MKDPLLIASSMELGVDIVSVAHFAKLIYDQTDSISYEDFGLLVSRFRTSKLASGKDMMDLRLYLTMEMLDLGSRLVSFSTDDDDVSVEDTVAAI